MQERKQYKISLPMTEKQKKNVEELLSIVANFSGVNVTLEEIEKPEEVQEEKEWPKEGDVYYYIDSDGEIVDSNFYAGALFCKNLISIGNRFKTKEEAEFEVERLKVIAEMKKFAEPEDSIWDGENQHWVIYFNTIIRDIDIDYYTTHKYDYIYFKSIEKAKECVKTIGEDRIKKYYLGIKE